MCAICDLRIEFSVDHPMTLNVAVATRQAIDDGLLPATVTHVNPLEGTTLRQDAIASLKATQRGGWRPYSGPPELRALPNRLLRMLMIESRTWWAFFHPTDFRIRPELPPGPTLYLSGWRI